LTAIGQVNGDRTGDPAVAARLSDGALRATESASATR